jgi:hypothetical protein
MRPIAQMPEFERKREPQAVAKPEQRQMACRMQLGLQTGLKSKTVPTVESPESVAGWMAPKKEFAPDR